jgi:creatinine amidohydrolase
MADTVLMEEMTWREIQQAIQQGKHTVILVAASIEQHGPHLPTGTDTIIGYALAQGIARKLGNALVAPVLRPGLSRHHMDFPGTMTLRIKTFVKVIEEYCFSLQHHGFKNVILFVSHGGNSDVLKGVIPSIAKKCAPALQILFVYPVEKNLVYLQDYLNKKGISPERAGVHAGFSETSMMLALRPDLVAMGKARPGLVEKEFYRPENLEKSKMESFVHGIKSLSANGILGDPTGSDSDTGKAILERKIGDIAEEIANNLKG